MNPAFKKTFALFLIGLFMAIVPTAHACEPALQTPLADIAMRGKQLGLTVWERDAKQVYYQGQVLAGADAASFTPLYAPISGEQKALSQKSMCGVLAALTGYAKDKHALYFLGLKIKLPPGGHYLATPAPGWAVTRYGVYFQGRYLRSLTQGEYLDEAQVQAIATQITEQSHFNALHLLGQVVWAPILPIGGSNTGDRFSSSEAASQPVPSQTLRRLHALSPIVGHHFYQTDRGLHHKDRLLEQGAQNVRVVLSPLNLGHRAAIATDRSVFLADPDARQLEGADPASIKLLGYGYASDKDRVYFDKTAFWSPQFGAIQDDSACPCSASDTEAVCTQRLGPKALQTAQTELVKQLAVIETFRTQGWSKQEDILPTLMSAANAQCKPRSVRPAAKDFELVLESGLPYGRFSTLPNWVWIAGHAQFIAPGSDLPIPRFNQSRLLQNKYYVYDLGPNPMRHERSQVKNYNCLSYRFTLVAKSRIAYDQHGNRHEGEAFERWLRESQQANCTLEADV